MEQAPGPRGSPHDPQDPVGMAGWEDPPLFADTAKTESWGCSFLLWHFGHSAFCCPKTKASNSWLQRSQIYSKIGM
jgi:hypothetical protein